MSQHFDVVILGGRLSAVIAAAMLAKRGLRGLLVDQGELASMDAGLFYDLATVPSGSPIMEVVYRELGLEAELPKKGRSLSPILQVILPDQRLDLSPDRTHFLAELERGFGPGPAANARAALERWTSLEADEARYLTEAGELPATGFFGRRTADSALKRHEILGQTVAEAQLFAGLPPLLAELFLGPLPFVTHLDARRPEEVKVARFLRPLLRMMRGLSRLDGSRGARGLFLEILGQRSFEVRRSAAESVEPGGKQVALRLAGQREPITAEVLIDASADLSGLDVVPNSLRKKDLAQLLQSVKPKGFLHTLSLEIDEGVVPPGLGEQALLLNGRRDPTRYDLSDPDAEDRPIWLTRRPAIEEGRVQLVASHPVSTVRAHAQSLDHLEEVMRARIERLIPFLMDGRPEIHALSGASAIKHKQPVLPHPLYDPALDPKTGLTGLPTTTGWKNVLLAGPTVLPGLGAEGEYLSAIQAADHAAALVGGGKKKRTLATASLS